MKILGKLILGNIPITKRCLQLFLKLHSFSYKMVSMLSVRVNNGLHPKHRIMNYHKFFVDRVSETDVVLDIGCGNGALTYDISLKAKSVVAVDINKENILIAESKYYNDNIEYICADATVDLLDRKFDVIILSNVLEHLSARVEMLIYLKKCLNYGGKFLIRVPCLDRDWISLYKKELGLPYMLDPTHYIEYTNQTFAEEIEAACLSITYQQRNFGEIWAVSRDVEVCEL